MRRPYRLIVSLALLTALCMMVSGCGTPQETDTSSQTASSLTGSEPETTTEQSFVLPYTSNDTLDPYSAQTKNNQELSTLLYDSLIRLDDAMEAEYWIAESIELNGTTCVIDLRDVKFSDGSSVTAEDVTYSIKAAKEETNGRYADKLSNIVSQSAASATRVFITLQCADPYFIHLLDFPIFKRGTETNTNTDNKALPPVGSGRYTYHAEGQRYWLEANVSWQGGDIGIQRIELKNLPDDEAVEYSMQTSGISAYYTNLSDNEFPKMTGSTVSVPLFNLVYLGVNTRSDILSDTALRHALSNAVDRTKFCSDIFYGSAQPAKGPIPSCFAQVEGLQTISTEKNTDEVVAQLNELGYNNRDSEGYLTREGQRLSLRLVYNAEQPVRGTAAAFLASELKAVGIEVTLAGLSYDAYVRAVEGGSFDLYLAEMKLQNNFDLLPLVRNDAVASPDSSVRTAAQSFHDGTGSLTELLSSFSEEMPIIPLCHRMGLLTFSSALKGSLTPGFSDIYAGLEHCTLS